MDLSFSLTFLDLWAIAIIVLFCLKLAVWEIEDSLKKHKDGPSER